MTKRPVIINEIAGLDASQGVYEIPKKDLKEMKKKKDPNNKEKKDSPNF